MGDSKLGPYLTFTLSFFKDKKISSAKVAEEKSVESLKNIESTSFKKAIENGMKIVLLSTDDKDYWRELSIPIYKRFLERTGESGQLAFDSVNSF